jgi:hypothetical protein
LLLATCESPRIISRHTKRNKKWALKKFGEFLPVPSDEDLTSFLSFFSVLQRRSFSHLGRLEVAWNPATMDHHLRGEMMISAFLYARVSSREQEHPVGRRVRSSIGIRDDHLTLMTNLSMRRADGEQDNVPGGIRRALVRAFVREGSLTGFF